MQDHEIVIPGAVPPKKKRPTAKIFAIILLFTAVVATVYYVSSGKADSFVKNTLEIAVQSWKEVFMPWGDGQITAEVSLGPALPTYNEPSSTPDLGQVSSSENQYAAPSKVKKPVKKISKSQTGASRFFLVTEATGTAKLSTNDSVQAPTSSHEATTADPATVADSNTEPSPSPASSGVASGSPGKPSQCSISRVASINVPSRIILNEIAWMGSPTTTGETAAKAANREWIELKNITQTEVDLAGWQIIDSSGSIDIAFGTGDKIDPERFYLLSRDGNAVQGISPNKAYSGSMSNSRGSLAVFDASCGVSDALDASRGWPGGDNVTKQTMERKVGGTGWQTSLLPRGTPNAENSIGAAQDGVGVPISSSTYAVSVTIAGDGAGKITSKPAGISCGSTAPTTGTSVCIAEYKSGTSLTLTATPGSNVTFAGWTGPCSGTESCTFSVGGTISATAQFHSMLLEVPSDNSPSSNLLVDNSSTSVQLPDDGEASSTDSTIVASSTPLSSSTSSGISESQATSTPQPVSVVSLNHIIIAQVQIAGASSANDFVKIYNPTAMPIDLGGWKLRKKSSTGTDSSLRELPKGTAIAPGVYFAWANSSNGFAQSLGADASSTETLSANNSVAIFDGSGVTVDAVAWGTGTNQYVEGSSYSQNPAASQILTRKSSDGMLIDTGNNADDFMLQ